MPGSTVELLVVCAKFADVSSTRGVRGLRVEEGNQRVSPRHLGRGRLHSSRLKRSMKDAPGCSRTDGMKDVPGRSQTVAVGNQWRTPIEIRGLPHTSTRGSLVPPPDYRE